MWTLNWLIACTPEPVDPEPDTAGPEPAEIAVITLNVESGDSVAETVAETVARHRGEALWGFTEVRDRAYLDTLAAAAAGADRPPFATLLGTTGYELRLALAWDESRLDLVDHEELHEINVGGTVRAPLVGRFRVVENDAELLVVVNHLWRTDRAARHEQSSLLNAWAREQALPAVSLGDFNYDWGVEDGDASHDRGYDLLTEDAVWTWVRPDPLVMTQCNFQYNSVLDFVFVAGGAREWPATAEILETQSSYCHDDERRTDHRPVRADLLIPAP